MLITRKWNIQSACNFLVKQMYYKKHNMAEEMCATILYCAYNLTLNSALR